MCHIKFGHVHFSHTYVISKVTYFHGWINGVPIKDVDKIILCNTMY